MDFIKLIRSIEELIYEICLWILQIPKTFLKIVQPWWTIRYVNQELEKAEKERFQEYVSPILLWIIIVVLPAFIFFKGILNGIPPENELYREMLGESRETRILLVSILLIICPLVFAAGIQLKQKKAITKEFFKANFFIQVYAFTVYEFFMIWILPVSYATDDSALQGFSYIFLLFGSLYGWWFIYYQMYIIKTLLNISWGKSLLWLSPFLVIACAFLLLAATFVLTLYLPNIE